MALSGYRWRCPCGFKIYASRMLSEDEEIGNLREQVQAHRAWHRQQVVRLGRRIRTWDGKHMTTCPYECDCPQEHRRPE